MKRIFVSLMVLAALAGPKVSAAPETGYHIIKRVSLPGAGGWDYVFVDAAGRRVYVSHATQVQVLNADTFEPMGTIPNTPGVHGIAVAAEFGRGFITAGKSDSVIIFDLKSLKPLSEVKVGKKPDAILYDPATKHVYAMNGDSGSASVINVTSIYSHVSPTPSIYGMTAAQVQERSRVSQLTMEIEAEKKRLQQLILRKGR